MWNNWECVSLHLQFLNTFWFTFAVHLDRMLQSHRWEKTNTFLIIDRAVLSPNILFELWAINFEIIVLCSWVEYWFKWNQTAQIWHNRRLCLKYVSLTTHSFAIVFCRLLHISAFNLYRMNDEMLVCTVWNSSPVRLSRIDIANKCFRSRAS